MATPFRLTPRPIRVTAITKQNLQDSLDVSAYDEIDALCAIDAIASGTGLAIKLITGMQKETEDGWVTLLSWTAGNLDTLGDCECINASTRVLKFIRWEVTGVGGAASITFDISGMLRRR